MRSKTEPAGDLQPEEITRRRESALKKMLSTPHKAHSDSKVERKPKRKATAPEK
jgi:hypothetical protein